MRHLDTSNIDEWLFDHFEGQLSFEEESRLVDFLDAHPEYKQDLDHWANARVEEPEQEYPAMSSLLMEEPAKILVGSGAVAGGFAAWQRWGAALVASGGILWMGYEFGQSNSVTPYQGDEGVYAAADLSDQNNNNTYQTSHNDFSLYNHNTHNPFAGSATSATPFAALSSQFEATTAKRPNHHAFPFFAQPNPGAGQSTQTTNTPDPAGSVVFGVDGQQHTAPGDHPAAAQHEGTSGNDGSIVQRRNEVDALTSAQENAETSAFDERTTAEKEAANNNGATAGNGFFNDPNWAKLMMSKAGNNRQAVAGSNVEREELQVAIVKRDRTPTGVWPFKVPYRGVGFHNDHNITFVAPETNPLQVNPALAGSSGEGMHRIDARHRYQWANTDAAQHRSVISYDTYIKGLKGGLGIMATNDILAGGAYNSNHIGITYAPTFTLRSVIKKDDYGIPRKHVVSITPAVKVGYTQRRVDESKLSGTTVVEPYRGYALQISDNPSAKKAYGYRDVSFGLHLNTNNMYAGAAVDHLTSPVERLEDSNFGLQRVPRRFTAYAGTEFKRTEDSETTYRPSLLFAQQGTTSEVWLSQELQMKYLLIGVGVAQNGSYSGRLGTQLGAFSVSYQYDMSRSEVQDAKSSSHAVNLSLNIH